MSKTEIKVFWGKKKKPLSLDTPSLSDKNFNLKKKLIFTFQMHIYLITYQIN